jgi:hypothetical protein
MNNYKETLYPKIIKLIINIDLKMKIVNIKYMKSKIIKNDKKMFC